MIPNERKIPVMSIKLKNEAAKNMLVRKKSLKISKVQSESLKWKFLQLFVTINSVNLNKKVPDGNKIPLSLVQQSGTV
jgi:hypothetical protein